MDLLDHEGVTPKGAAQYPFSARNPVGHFTEMCTDFQEKSWELSENPDGQIATIR
jgi:hypothetical protein